MADRLEDVFARFEASATPLFQPAPVSALPAMTRRGRGRRVWTGLVAGAMVLLIGAPFGALTLGGASPSPRTVEEESNWPGPYIPGWGGRKDLQFGFGPGVIWAYSAGECDGDVCTVPPALAASVDQDNTWQVRPGGEGLRDAKLIVSPRGNVYLREPGSATITQVLETGASIVMPALPGPPDLLSSGNGDLILECPGEETYGGQDALACARPRITDLTAVVDPVAPEGMGRLTQLLGDGTGRTWLMGVDAGSRTVRLSSSPDGGRTWARPVTREIPPGEDQLRIAVSPVDGDAWLVAGGPVRAWRLTHDGEDLVVQDGDGRDLADVRDRPAADGAPTPFDATEAHRVWAVGGGTLLLAPPSARLRTIEVGRNWMPDAEHMPTVVDLDVLRDGTVVALYDDGRYGVGLHQFVDGGIESSWTFIYP